VIAYKESEYQPEIPIRVHPYLDAEYDERVRYHNFRETPELIREKLEDFKPFEPQQAVKTFYELVEWINGPESELESNDCAFTGPKTNISVNSSKKKMECKGRLMVFFRRLPNNLNTDTMKWLLNATGAYIERTDEQTWQDGIVGLSFMKTAFAALNNQIGEELVLRFWAFGDTEQEVFDNLDRLFRNLLTALEGVSKEVSKALVRQSQS
jgi:hypothetical protein